MPTRLILTHSAGFQVKEEPDEVYARYVNAMKADQLLELTAVKGNQLVYVNPNQVIYVHERVKAKSNLG